MSLEMLKISLPGIYRRRDEPRNNLVVIIHLFPRPRLMKCVEVRFFGQQCQKETCSVDSGD